MDLRSLACFRVLLACVVLYDVSQSWSLIDDWAGLQGFYDGLPLPSWIGFSDETILRLIFGTYAACTIGFLLGYRTGSCTLAHLPEAFLSTATHVVMAVEWVIPLLLLSPWKRSLLRMVGVLALAGMHGAMWLLMDIGSFSPTMVAAATALLPAAFWNQVARRMTGRKMPAAIEQTEQGSQGAASLACCGRARQYLLMAFFGLCTVINIEGDRLRVLNGDLRMLYLGATWVLKLKYLLGVESSWAMYAPEPTCYGGWWVALGQRQDGSVIDLITGEPPTLDAPFPRKGAHYGLRGHYWSQAPYQDGPQRTYLRFLLWRDRTAPEVDRIVDLHLLHVYECYEPACMSGSSHRRYPLSILTWPDADKTNRAPATAGAESAPNPSDAWVLYRAEFDRLGTPDWKPARLEPDRSSP